MPLKFDVSIWGWQGIGVEWGHVGHVMVSDPTTGKALLSQFPHRLGQASVPKGPNTLLSFADTYTEEGGKPDAVYEVTIDAAFVDPFMDMVNNHVHRETWDWDPTSPYQTHCARSSYDALRAGGLAFDPHNIYVIQDGQTNEILPNSLWYLLQRSSDPKIKLLAQRSQNFDDLGVIQDYEKLVSFARREKLWERELSTV